MRRCSFYIILVEPIARGVFTRGRGLKLRKPTILVLVRKTFSASKVNVFMPKSVVSVSKYFLHTISVGGYKVCIHTGPAFSGQGGRLVEE